jgi:hypothetical protein
VHQMSATASKLSAVRWLETRLQKSDFRFDDAIGVPVPPMTDIESRLSLYQVLKDVEENAAANPLEGRGKRRKAPSLRSQRASMLDPQGALSDDDGVASSRRKRTKKKTGGRASQMRTHRGIWMCSV